MTGNQQRTYRCRDRHGVVMIAALVLVLVAGSLASTWTSALIAAKTQTKAAGERSQAEVLAESAIRRAVATRIANGSYTDEAWQLTADETGQTYTALAEILVEDDEQGRVIRVTARVTVPSTGAPWITRTVSLTVANENAEGDQP